MKSYRLQGLECDKNGTRFSESCIGCGQEILMCRKYGGGCRSGKCLWARLSIWERFTWNLKANPRFSDCLCHSMNLKEEKKQCREGKHSRKPKKK